MPYQLPDDAVVMGHKETSPCYWEPFFHSPSKHFTGTEEEFYNAGHAYIYYQVNKHWRSIYLSPKVLKDAGLL